MRGAIAVTVTFTLAAGCESQKPVARDTRNPIADVVELVTMATPDAGIDAAKVGGIQLSLSGCELSYERLGRRRRVTLEFPLPCRFNRDKSGSVRLVRTERAETVLIEASRPAPLRDDSGARDCETFIRGVTVTSGEVRLSVQTQKVAHCLPASWDEAMFQVFAANTLTADASSVDGPSQ